MTVTEFLQQKVPFLQGITEDQAHYLAKSSEQKPFKKGQTVLFAGVTVDGLHVIAQGKVEIFARVEKGKGFTKVAELGPGDVFGETSILEFTMAGATVKSAADDTLVFIIPEAAFRKMLATDEDLKARTMALIESRKPKKPEENKPA